MTSDREKGGGGLSLQTLLISSLAAVTAAVVVPTFWEQGTLFATAMTPVVVALASEAFRRPAEKITAVAPRVARRTATGAAVRRYEPDAAHSRHPERVGARGEGPERVAPPPARRPDDPFGLRAAERPRRRGWVRLALATGLLGFVTAAAVVTATELTIFDGPVSGDRGKTSLFGGKRRPAAEEPAREATPTTTPEEEASPTPTPTPTPGEEVTPTPTPSATPTPAPAEPAPVAPAPTAPPG